MTTHFNTPPVHSGICAKRTDLAQLGVLVAGLVAVSAAAREQEIAPERIADPIRVFQSTISDAGRAGRSVPESLSVVGFDGPEVGSREYL
jgi:hypothetical protein